MIFNKNLLQCLRDTINTTSAIIVEDMYISYNDCGIVGSMTSLFDLYIYIFLEFSLDGETPKMHQSHCAGGGSSTGEHCTQLFYTYLTQHPEKV